MAPIILSLAIVLSFISLLVAFPSFRVEVAILLALGIGAYFLLTSERGAKEQNAGRNQNKQESVELQAGVTAGRPMEFTEHHNGAMRAFHSFLPQFVVCRYLVRSFPRIH